MNSRLRKAYVAAKFFGVSDLPASARHSVAKAARSSEDTRETYEEQSGTSESSSLPKCGPLIVRVVAIARTVSNTESGPLLRRITARDVLFEMLYCGGLSRNHPFKSVANR